MSPRSPSFSSPRRALVLAAGFGGRLSPLTLDLPKPLFPCRGEPLIGRLLRQLGQWGVVEVCVNLHHLADRMVEALPGLCPPGMRLTLSFEPTILGTGGPLRRMRGFFEEEPFWMCNADLRLEADPRPLLADFRRHRPLAALWMIPDRGPRTVRCEQGRVVDFHSGGRTFSGLHLVSPRIWNHVPSEERFYSVVEVYEAALRAGERIDAVELPGAHWADLGTPDRLLAENGGSLVLPGAVVDKGAELRDAVVGPGARVRRGRPVSGVVAAPHRVLDSREQAWVPDAEAVELLPARGSDRRFLRVFTPSRSVIRMTWGEARPENHRFPSLTRFLLRRGLPVPALLHTDPDGRGCWLEDLGRIHLLDRLREGSPTRNLRDMRQVLALTARLHAIPPTTRLRTEPPFTRALYDWEQDLFRSEFLSRHASGLDPDRLAEAQATAVAALLREPSVLVHRDLQSTNFLWSPHGFTLIDYQGLRPGPAAYDLASLLADPYVDRPLDLQMRLLDAYNRIASRPVSPEVYRHAALQRLTQALGAYGRLGAQPATIRFLDHIPAALRQLQALVLS